MTINIFGLFAEVVGGLFIGSLFGFLLQKAGVTDFRTIKNQLLLKDFTVMKVILSAIVTGSLGLYIYRNFINEQSLIINSTTLKAAFYGGAIFGVGMATLGFCPGTCIGALAEKSKAAFWGIAGMLIGAFSYSKLATFIQKHFKPQESICKTTLDEQLGVSPLIIILFLAFFIVIIKTLDKKNLIRKNK